MTPPVEPASVTVVTPSIPERSELLAQNIASVRAQTVPVAAHLIRIQGPPRGRLHPLHIAEQLNILLEAVDSEWVGFLSDDDMYLPHHVDTIVEHLRDDHDVVYTWPTSKRVGRIDCNGWSNAQVLERLERANFTTSAVTFRTEALRRVGGWGGQFRNGVFSETGVRFEDRDLLIRLARTGAGFHCVPAVTWDYRWGPWAHTLNSDLSADEVPSDLQILGACYGAGDLFVDVTDVVASYVIQGYLDLPVANDVLGGDPAPNRAKGLRIRWSSRGKASERGFAEGSHVTLP